LKAWNNEDIMNEKGGGRAYFLIYFIIPKFTPISCLEHTQSFSCLVLKATLLTALAKTEILFLDFETLKAKSCELEALLI
jgi:hypothetical protein